MAQRPASGTPEVVSRPIFVFNHVAKTAGSSLRSMLWNVFPGEHIAFVTQIDRHDQELAELNARLSHGDCVDAVISHAGFGIHDQLVGQREYSLYTMLRDPVDRTISHYFYEIQKGRYSSDLSLEEFLQEGTIRRIDHQAHYFGGTFADAFLRGGSDAPDAMPLELLGRAKSNLAQHAAIGLSERFDESLVLLGHTFGWPLWTLLYESRNTGTFRRDRRPLSSRERRLVEAANHLDLELYADATSLFESQLARVPDVDRRLATLRRLQSIHRRLGVPGHRALRAMSRSRSALSRH